MPLQAAVLTRSGVSRWAVEMLSQGREPVGPTPTLAAPRRKEFVLQLHVLLMLPDRRTAGLQCWRWSQGRWQVPPGFYFAAIAARQLRRLGSPVEDVIRHCIKDTRRSISRGCGVAALKASYPVRCLVVFVVYAPLCPFDLDSVDSTGDTVIIMSWWMLREVESSAGMYSLCLNLELMEGTLWIPVSKTDIRSTVVARAMACACKILRQKLCPFHACQRHLQRVKFLLLDGPAARKPRSPPTGRTACHIPEELHEQLA